jgi:hypothetical protein
MTGEEIKLACQECDSTSLCKDCSLSKAVGKKPLNLGKFKISGRMLREDSHFSIWGILRKNGIFQRDVEYDQSKDEYLYTAESERFNEVREGEEVPEYMIFFKRIDFDNIELSDIKMVLNSGRSLPNLKLENIPTMCENCDRKPECGWYKMEIDGVCELVKGLKNG